MTSFTFLPCQQAALNAVTDAIHAGLPSGCVIMPRGTGHRFMALAAATQFPGRTLVLVPFDDDVLPTVTAARKCWPGIDVGVIHGDHADWRGHQITVASVGSLHDLGIAPVAANILDQVLTPYRPDRIPADYFQFQVIVNPDVFMGTAGNSWIQDFQPAFRLAIGADMINSFGWLVCQYPKLFAYPIKRAVADGVLVPPRCLVIDTPVEFGSPPSPWNRSDTAAHVQNCAALLVSSERNRAIAAAYLPHAAGRHGLTFTDSTEQAAALAHAFRDVGVAAVAVSEVDYRNERPQLFARFEAGALPMLVTTERPYKGRDDRGISAIIMAGPRGTVRGYESCISRGLLPFPERGKSDCLVFDVLDRTRPWFQATADDLFGNSVTSAVVPRFVLDTLGMR